MAFIAPVVTGFSAALSGAKVCRSVARPRSTVTMKASPAMPFMEMPASLEDESIVGNAGFDPLNFSGVFDLKFLQEAEIKHGMSPRLPKSPTFLPVPAVPTRRRTTPG